MILKKIKFLTFRWKIIVLKILTYQCTAAKENHEDDEGFKVIMLHYSVASPPQVPPTFAPSLSDVQIQTWTSSHTVYHMKQDVQQKCLFQNFNAAFIYFV